jgi:ornithine cyclodeaminase
LGEGENRVTTIISFEEGEAGLDWIGLTDALAAGHALPKAVISDSFLYRGKDTLLQRQAWIDGIGIGVKSATVFPGNPAQDVPMINGAVTLFDDAHGILQAMVDFHLVTKWKTAGDSLLAARRLARPDSKSILILGSGTVARSLRDAYAEVFPDASFVVWSRTLANAEALAAEYDKTHATSDLAAAVASADVIGSAMMAYEPVIKGEWLSPGTHLDLIGAYRPDMREADDEVLRRATLYVDSFDTTIEHIGELKTPIAEGVISRDEVVADYYQLDKFVRQSDEEITLCKNGGGAHLDLMVSDYIRRQWEARNR